jgi:thiol:disulfide interchange protein
MNVRILALLVLLMGAGLVAQTAPAPPPRQEPAILQGATVAGVAAGYLQTDAFLKFVADAEAGVVQRSALDNRGALSLVVLILIGGLALNLTPCVLPMIPINLAIIGAGSQAGSRRRGWLLGGAYGLAMALVYGVIGGVVVVTAGTFGTINSSPWFNAAIAVLFVVLGLAMFDVITIDASTLMQSGQVDQSKRGSLSLAFFMGGVAALLAGACVAPVVIQVIVLSSKLYAGGTTIALGLPLLLGVGMALPWPLAGAGIAALPKPGAWMVRVKQVLGVVILATAVYYGYEAYHIFTTRSATPAPAAANIGSDGAYTTLADGLAAAKRDGKPVFLDMWATWCKNCVVMEQTTFKDPKVVKALDGYVKIKLQSEDLEQGDAKVLLDRFETFGLPTYAILQFRQ